MAKRYIKRKSAVKPITGSIVDTTNIDDKSKNTYSAGVIDDKISKAGGVEVGTIVHINKSETTPEGWQDVIDESTVTKVTDISEILSAKDGFTILDSTIYKQGNKYWGSVVVKINEGTFSQGVSYTPLAINKYNTNVANKGCFLSKGRWQAHAVGYCYVNVGEIAIIDLNTSSYSVAKIDIDFVIKDGNVTKPIQKVAVTELDPITGSIVDGTNIDDKTTNTYSANTIDGLVSDDYSTEETVVGTYLGKPLYKRTYTNFTLSTGTNIEYYIFETDTNKVMKKAEGVLWLNENDTTNYFTSVVGSGGVDFGASEFSSNYQNGNMYVSRAVNSNFITKGLEVTAYYTKTTD